MGAASEIAAATIGRAARAEEAGSYEAAFNLLTGLPESVRDTGQVARVRARLLVLTGRPQDALVVLGSHGITTLPAVLEFPDAMLAAALAATGNREAYRRLLGVTARTPQETRQLTALRAVAAEACGDHRTADQSWHALVYGFGDRTPRALGRVTAAQVAMRDPDRGATAATSVLLAVANLDMFDLAADPRPAIEAAAVLEWRGDVAGARLLLEAVRTRHRRNDAVRSALRRLTPTEEMGLHRLRLAGFVIAIVALMAAWQVGTFLAGVPRLEVLQWAIPFAGRRFWVHRVALPGLTRSDSVAWRATRGMRFVSRKGELRSKDQRGWFGLVGFVAFLVVQGASYPLVVNMLDQAGELIEGREAAYLVVVTLTTLAASAAAVGGFYLARRARQVRIAGRLRRVRRG